MAGLYLSYKMTAYDADGNITYQEEKQSKSFVKAFLAILAAVMGDQILSANHNDTGGTARAIRGNPNGGSAQPTAFGSDGLVNISTKGIVLGTGTTAVAATDAALGTQIAHGTSSGQLVHLAQVFAPNAINIGSITTLTTVRSFLNQSGGSIVVGEIGIYADAYTTAGGLTPNQFCIARDVPSPATVVNGGSVSVQYQLTTTI